MTGPPDTVEHNSEACTPTRIFPQDPPAASCLFTAPIAAQITAPSLGAGTRGSKKTWTRWYFALKTTQVSPYPATYGGKVTVMFSSPTEKYLHVQYVVQENYFICTEKGFIFRHPEMPDLATKAIFLSVVSVRLMVKQEIRHTKTT